MEIMLENFLVRLLNSNEVVHHITRDIQLQGVTHKVEVAISENIVSLYRKYRDDNPEET